MTTPIPAIPRFSGTHSIVFPTRATSESREKGLESCRQSADIIAARLNKNGAKPIVTVEHLPEASIVRRIKKPFITQRFELLEEKEQLGIRTIVTGKSPLRVWMTDKLISLRLKLFVAEQNRFRSDWPDDLKVRYSFSKEVPPGAQ